MKDKFTNRKVSIKHSDKAKTWAARKTPGMIVDYKTKSNVYAFDTEKQFIRFLRLWADALESQLVDPDIWNC